MLKLNKKVEYALMALLYMDRQKDLVAAREVSEACRAPADLLGKVLQALAKGGLIHSVQGAHGGYRLARPAREITLGEVIEAVEGPVHLVSCQKHPEDCGQFETCRIRRPVAQVQQQLQDYMHGLSLDAFDGKSLGRAS